MPSWSKTVYCQSSQHCFSSDKFLAWFSPSFGFSLKVWGSAFFLVWTDRPAAGLKAVFFSSFLYFSKLEWVKGSPVLVLVLAFVTSSQEWTKQTFYYILQSSINWQKHLFLLHSLGSHACTPSTDMHAHIQHLTLVHHILFHLYQILP